MKKSVIENDQIKKRVKDVEYVPFPFNPKLSKFLKYKDPTLLGLAWAIYWRICFATLIISIGLALLGGILEILTQ